MNTIWEILLGITPLLIGVLTLGIAFYKLNKTNQLARKEQTKEFTQLADKVLINEKDIAKIREEMATNCAHYNNELEKVKADRADRVRQVYSEIETLRKLHDTDTKDLYASLEKAVEKTTGIEERHHNEVMTKMENLTVQITTMCATFAEYRKTRNGNSHGKDKED